VRAGACRRHARKTSFAASGMAQDQGEFIAADVLSAAHRARTGPGKWQRSSSRNGPRACAK
jgi:hypothetical protein